MAKEYTLIGGNGTRVSPLEVTESGTYEAGDSRAFNPVKVNVPSGSSTLSGLTDVDISNPSNGQTLVYDAATQKWVNGDASGGSPIFWLTFRASAGDYSVGAQIPGVRQNDDRLIYVSSWGGDVDVDHDLIVGLPSNGCDVVAIDSNSLTFTNVNQSVMPTVTGDLTLDGGYLYLAGNGVFSAVGYGGN